MQNKIFLESEGDAWFSRNEDRISNANQVINSSDILYTLHVIKPFSNRINKVLEIGCCNGVKLEVICDSLDAEGFGIDPSVVAVQTGNDRKKNVKTELIVGSADNLPFEDASFDLVSFAFSLYLFDRGTLLKSLSEADRVLKQGGFLVVTDFDPNFQHKRPYSHFQGLISYKQNYASIFTQTGLYHLVSKHSFSHRSPFFDESSDERVSTNILYKETDPYPVCG